MRKLLAFLFFSFSFAGQVWAQCSEQIDARAYGTITATSSEAGLCRIRDLENLIDNMAVISAHPRLYINDADIAALQAKSGQAAYTAVINGANSTTATGMINSAMAYLLTGTTSYATNVYTYINATTYSTWQSAGCGNSNTSPRKAIALASLAFDWAYDGLNQTQRDAIQTKIESVYPFAAKRAEIDAGTVPSQSCTTNYRSGTRGETFHREEYFFYAMHSWPEVAFAGHNADAEYLFKARWRPTWHWGDAARYAAYMADGYPVEGYVHGPDSVSWFRVLKSATGIDLIYDTDWPHYEGAGLYYLYKMDFGTNRSVLHRGISVDTGGSVSYDPTDIDTWKQREFSAVAMGVLLPTSVSAYAQWLWLNELSSEEADDHMVNNYYIAFTELNDVAKLIYFDSAATSTDIRTATNTQLPYARFFTGGNAMIARSSWADNAAIVEFYADPVLTKSSHGDYDTNSLNIYRRGNLTNRSGIYDNAAGDDNMNNYQKKTVAHNTLLLVDPANPDNPQKPTNRPDPGGTETRTTRSLGPSYPGDINNWFLTRTTRADWADLLKYENHADYAYAAGDATEAYSSRASNFDRNVIVWRINSTDVHVVDYSRVTGLNASYQKKLLVHTVTQPQMNGSITSTQIANHIEIFNGDGWNSKNYEDNSKLHVKVLLPASPQLRRIGGEDIITEGTATFTNGSRIVTGTGTNWLTSLANYETNGHRMMSDADPNTSSSSWLRVTSVDSNTQLTLLSNYTRTTHTSTYKFYRGYQYWHDGSSPRNITLRPDYRDCGSVSLSCWQEAGQWRVEIMPPNNNNATDYFLNVFTAVDAAGSAPTTTLITSSGGDDMYGALVDSYLAMFSKTGADVDSTTFSATYNGTVKILLADLQSGNYTVTNDGTPVVTNQPASSGGTLYFSDNPGAGGSVYVVTRSGAALDILTTTLDDGTQNSAYDESATVTGGGTLTACDITVGSLPTGISVAVSGSTCRFTGTPTGSGTSTFTLRATDSLSNTDSQQLSITVAAESPFLITTTTVSNAVVGTAYNSGAIVTTGGTLPITFSVSAGSIPAWGTLNTSTGAITGTPNAAGVSTYTIQAADSAAHTDTQAFTLTTDNIPLNILTTSLSSCLTGLACSHTLTKEGGSGSVTWSFASGSSAPPGMSLNSSSGVLSGTPTTANNYVFSVVVTDANSSTDTQDLSLDIDDPTLPSESQTSGRGISGSGGTF